MERETNEENPNWHRSLNSLLLGLEGETGNDSYRDVQFFHTKDATLYFFPDRVPAMNGIEVANALKRVVPKSKIAIFSNYTDDFGTMLSSAVGIDAIIAKGSLADMAKSLNKWIDRKAPTES